MKKLIILLLVCAQISCSTNQTSKSSAKSDTPPKDLIVFDDKEDGWGADIRLSITNISENDSSKIYKVVSNYNNKNLGVLVFISKKKEGNGGFGKYITLKSTGSESDNLLILLETLYKQKLVPNSKFVNSISVGYVNLREFAKSIGGKEDANSSSFSEYKLFFESKDGIAELYLNINPDDKWIELREKDPEFRAAIIEILKK